MSLLRVLRVLCGHWILLMLLALPAACSPREANPSFPLPVTEARAALVEMEQSPRPLARPLVVVGGWGDVGIGTSRLSRRFYDITGDDRIVNVTFGFFAGFDRCREHLIEVVQREFPNNDPDWTVEVDVVAVSMGGLVAHYAAAPVPRSAPTGASGPPRRLRIARLFTLSTPHQGSNLARLPGFTSAHVAMRPGSDFIKRLEPAIAAANYRLYPYTRLGDLMVGAHRAAPPGQNPLWLPNQPFSFAHLGMSCDPRIVADIARHLRDEPPYSSRPAPLPVTVEQARPR